MKPVQLQFEASTRSWRQRLLGREGSLRGKASVGSLLTALLVASAAGLQAWQTHQQLADARRTLASLQRPAKPSLTAATASTRALSPAQRQAWNQVTRQLNIPWPALLDALEASLADDVALVAIEPDPRQGGLRVQAEARSLEALLAYAGQLGVVPLFDTVTLVKHETNAQDANRPVRLSLDLRLRAAGSTMATAAPRQEGPR